MRRGANVANKSQFITDTFFLSLSVQNSKRVCERDSQHCAQPANNTVTLWPHENIQETNLLCTFLTFKWPSKHFKLSDHFDLSSLFILKLKTSVYRLLPFDLSYGKIYSPVFERIKSEAAFSASVSDFAPAILKLLWQKLWSSPLWQTTRRGLRTLPEHVSGKSMYSVLGGSRRVFQKFRSVYRVSAECFTGSRNMFRESRNDFPEQPASCFRGFPNVFHRVL